MTRLYTIGYQGKSLRQLSTALRQAGADAVIDVRRHNTSQIAGYTKRDDLAFLLTEGFGLAYEHRLECSPPEDLLLAYKKEKGDWETFAAGFRLLLPAMRAAGADILARYQRPCLLCSEATPDHCHRRLVAEDWATTFPGLTIVHL